LFDSLTKLNVTKSIPYPTFFVVGKMMSASLFLEIIRNLEAKMSALPHKKKIECQKFSLKWSLVQFDPLCLCFHDCSL